MNRISLIFSFVLGLGFAFALPQSYAGERIVVDYKKEPTGSKSGLEYRYTFTVNTHKSQSPVDGADFTIATDMPSMPGAHHMPHVRAGPGKMPGTYSATIDFDMAGPWNLILRFTKPQRDQVVVSDTIVKQSVGKAAEKNLEKHDHSQHKHHQHSKH